MKSDEVERAAAELGRVIGGEALGDILHRAAYSSDASIYQILPVCVVAPRDVVDVSVVIKYARREGIAVAGRGAGSGVAGESLCGGIVLDMSRYMRRILGVEDGGARVICEPGVVLDELNEYLLRYGRKIGPDPSSGNRATVGGCVANNSTGAHSIAYGYIGDYVERVEAVLADGSVAEFVNDFKPSGEETEAGEIAKRCLAVLGGKCHLDLEVIGFLQAQHQRAILMASERVPKIKRICFTIVICAIISADWVINGSKITNHEFV